MNRVYGFDHIDGRAVPQLVVDRDHTISGVHIGTVHVEGGDFTLHGVLKGTLDIQGDVVAHISGTQQGTVSVASGASVSVTGAIEGTVSVEHGGTLVIEAGAKLAGSLHNDGLVVIRGVFGGAESGNGELRLEGTGYIKEPEIRDGMHFYDWSRR